MRFISKKGIFMLKLANSSDGTKQSPVALGFTSDLNLPSLKSIKALWLWTKTKQIWQRGAISLTPWLQPGDQVPSVLFREPFQRFLLRGDQEKPLETVRGMIRESGSPG
jgi:hypothetical protein